jgi:hypothetical protein
VQHRLQPPASSAAPTSTSPTRISVPDAAPLPTRRPRRPPGLDPPWWRPRPFSLAVAPGPPPRWLSSYSQYSMSPPPTPPLASPSLRPPAGVRVPWWPAGPRWGYALLTSAREMLASASIFK